MYLKDLELLIPVLRRDLDKLIQQKEYILEDSEILELSKDIDQLISRYYYLSQKFSYTF